MFAGKTHKGKVRVENQDAFTYGKKDNLYYMIVCDGMGGAKGGSVASDICIKQTTAFISENYHEEITDSELVVLIKKAIDKANRAIFELSAAEKSLKGMGTTIVIAVVRDNKLFLSHLGDSRIYLKRDAKFSLQTKDHSFVQEMVDMGELTPEEAKHHPNKNIITKAAGISGDIDIEVEAVAYKQGDILLLCTDGLSNLVADDEIDRVLSGCGVTEEAAETLVNIAIERGGTDNVTVVLFTK